MKIQRISGIQKKYLINIVLLLALALLLSSVGVGVYVRKNISNVVLDKYEFMTEKMGITLDGLYKKSEEVTAECITDKNVQRSLQVSDRCRVGASDRRRISYQSEKIECDG